MWLEGGRPAGACAAGSRRLFTIAWTRMRCGIFGTARRNPPPLPGPGRAGPERRKDPTSDRSELILGSVETLTGTLLQNPLTQSRSE